MLSVRYFHNPEHMHMEHFKCAKVVHMHVWKMSVKYWDLIPSLSGHSGLPEEQRKCIVKCSIFLVILSFMQLQKEIMCMGCKKWGHCSYAWVEDACKVWGHQFNGMQSIAATKEWQTSWLGKGTLEMEGENKIALEFILPTEKFKEWLKNFETKKRWKFPCLLHHHFPQPSSTLSPLQ